jgi:hypothetical protein
MICEIRFVIYTFFELFGSEAVRTVIRSQNILFWNIELLRTVGQVFKSMEDREVLRS